MMMTLAPRRVYVATRLFCDWFAVTFLSALGAGLVALVATQSPERAEDVVVGVGAVLFAALIWRALTVRVEFDEDAGTLRVRNLVRTYRIRLDDVRAATVGAYRGRRVRARRRPMPCVELALGAPTDASARVVQVHASMSRGRRTALVTLLEEQCRLRDIPCSITAMKIVDA